MTATVTPVHAARYGELQRILEQHVGGIPWPPVEGASYFAGAVLADCAVQEAAGVDINNQLLAALVIIHNDDNSFPIPDAVFAGIDEVEAHRLARLYGIDPDGHRYDVDQLETDATSPLTGHPLAQAFNTAAWLPQRPPPPVPIRERSWRHALVFERIAELHDAECRISRSCRDGEEWVRDLPYDAALVDKLIMGAKERLYDDDLDVADRLCAQAERVMVQRGQP